MDRDIANVQAADHHCVANFANYLADDLEDWLPVDI